MAKKKKTTNRKTRRPSKEEQERQKKRRRLIFTIILTIMLIFAAFRLGIFGVTLYNISRLFVGSLTYLLMIGLVMWLYAKNWLKKHSSYIIGYLFLFLGLLLECQVYFTAHTIGSSAFSLVMADLVAFKVTHFAGGGLLGMLIASPMMTFLSTIGTIIIGLVLLVAAAFQFSPWTIEDVTHLIAQKWQKGQEKRRAKKEAALKEAEDQALAQVPVDMETGEILREDPMETDLSSSEPSIELGMDHQSVTEETEETDDSAQINFTPKELLNYTLPGLDLFAPDKPKDQSKEKEIVRKNIHVLEETFKSFGIQAKVERAEIGPSVTKYEVKPAVGVRVSKIANLADDFALALAAKDVRIEAPIPGKSVIGIEVPNSEIATVTFRELWEQSKTSPKQLLEVPLGKSVNGSVRTFNLAKMPHLLVAGSTGSGKSVAVNGIIASILMKARPDQVKFLMIDPKVVELSVYNDIPHLLIPVVTNPRKASRALQKVVDEMEKRYELFSHFGVRNIETYNAKVEAYNSESDTKHIPMPLIVVIVDELADLMMVASKEVEDAIIRLGQKARAAGIHMILATQRPSVDVISGLIKANVPSRIAFAVSSGTDSRTILDSNGAEKLLGRGDMLFKPIDENHPVRLQGSFISDEDVEQIISFIKEQAEADYDDSFDPGEVSELDHGQGNANEGDPLFEEAKNLVLETQKASASMLQRRLSVGFNRASRLMEELEAKGVIGPAEGTKPRKVLQTK